MAEGRIRQIEDFVKQSIDAAKSSNLGIAHGFQHCDRVRGWALRIAEHETSVDREVVEAAALLHDVGLFHVEQRAQHAQVGAEIAACFLRERGLFTGEEIQAIAGAIRSHASLSGGGRPGEILRDADMLDAVGAVGIKRALTSAHKEPDYDPSNIKSDTWGMTAREFDRRFANGEGVGPTIVHQANFQISLYGNLTTETAKRIARPLVEFMKAYVIQLEAEVNSTRAAIVGRAS